MDLTKYKRKKALHSCHFPARLFLEKAINSVYMHYVLWDETGASQWKPWASQRSLSASHVIRRVSISEAFNAADSSGLTSGNSTRSLTHVHAIACDAGLSWKGMPAKDEVFHHADKGHVVSRDIPLACRPNIIPTSPFFRRA